MIPARNEHALFDLGQPDALPWPPIDDAVIALCLDAFACTFVPSSATRPSLMAPASSALWGSLRKSETVRKSGSLPAASNRKATSSTSRFWILRAEIKALASYPGAFRYEREGPR